MDNVFSKLLYDLPFLALLIGFGLWFGKVAFPQFMQLMSSTMEALRENCRQCQQDNRDLKASIDRLEETMRKSGGELSSKLNKIIDGES